MTHIEQAIREAVEKGGYDFFGYSLDASGAFTDRFMTSVIFLDPLFWQALGKARGWIDAMPSTYNYNVEIPEWKHQWHRFIDHLAGGKDADSFFASL
jgi:hypothetical protein